MEGKWLVALTLIVIVCFAAFFAILQFQPTAKADKKTLYQVAAYNTFILGNYTGFVSFSELAKHGNFGLGTLNGLGEMVELNGVFYQIGIDGKSVKIDPSETTPYATVTFFQADQTLQVSNLNYTQLKDSITQVLPNQDSIYAIKVSGYFDYAQTRSEPKQTQPYQNITIALQNQVLFNLTDVSGTAVGFWFPSNMNGVDLPGYHFHFITDDCTTGGHLLDCITGNVTVQIDQINKYELVLPCS